MILRVSLLVFIPLGRTGCMEGLELYTSLHPSRLSSDKTPAFQTPCIIASLEGRLCYKEQNAWVHFKMLLSPSSWWKLKGIFLWYSSWGPSRSLGGQTLKSAWPFYDWVPLELLSFRFINTEPLAINQLCWGSPTAALVSTEVFFYLWISALVGCDSLYPPASPSSSEATVHSVTSLLWQL